VSRLKGAGERKCDLAVWSQGKYADPVEANLGDGVYIFEHIPKTAGTTFQFSYVMAAFQVGEFLISLA
jgi:hypothetical protein